MNQAESSAPPFPRLAEHERAWRDLAREIAARRGSVREIPETTTPARRGQLVVIGSGIETVGFTLGDDELLRSADKVFFCVADPATVVWLKRLRPDAFDLYVLYDDRKPRYVTYMQMAEAMLHYVREGLRVVCVFYGHPGVFVLATHRSILIARREGHQAVMRPGVCALDCLCADLGVDPCHPGMQTHEATDMLVRRRKPDTSLHVVLWQVGLIGEMGFRRQGYINRNFSILVDYLQRSYGDEYPITHYVASRYPTIPPLIETYRLSELHDPAIQVRITGLSTFYLAPRDATSADPEMVERLGLLKPGQNVRIPTGALREIGSYGSRELKAFDDFATFEVPHEYHWQEETGASNFLIELREDVALQRLYAADAARALQDARFAGLTPSERGLLATRDSGAIQVAAKGIHRRDTSNHALIRELLRDRTGCAEFLRRCRAGAGVDLRGWLAAYAASHHFSFTEETLRIDLAHVRRHLLLPWTGVYAAAEPRLSVTILGNSHGAAGLLYVNDQRIRSFTYRGGALSWRTAGGNPSNGFLRFDVGASGRRIIGQVWAAGEPRPDQRYFEAAEIDPDRANLAPGISRFLRGEETPALNGSYALQVRGGRHLRRAELELLGELVKVGGTPVRVHRPGPGQLAWSGGPGELAQGQLNFLCNPFTDWPEVHGYVTAGARQLQCFGSRMGQPESPISPLQTTVPAWIVRQLAAISAPFLWQKWEKYHLTSRVVNRLGAPR